MESGSSISALLLSGTISFGIRFASLCFRLAFRPSTKPYEDISYDTSCPSIIGFISVLALIPLERQALLWSICILQNKCIQTASAATIIIAYNMAVSQMKSPKIVTFHGERHYYSTSIRGWCQELRWLKFHSHVVQVFAVTFGVGGSSIRSHKWLKYWLALGSDFR